MRHCALIPLLAGLLPLVGAMDIPLQPPLPTPVIQAKTLPEEQPVSVRTLRLQVQVHGLFAEVTGTVTISNPNARALEGDLEFPVPDNGTVCGYALDIDGTMVDGVIVAKDQARVILETERRQRVDPGLVEHVAGNVFRTRIFPIPANGSRTVAITWVAPLTVSGADAALRVPLPRTSIPELALRIDIAGSTVAPTLSGLGNITMTQWQQGYRAEATLRDTTPSDDLMVRLPQLPATLVQVERAGDEHVAAITVAAPVAAGAPMSPQRIGLVWDASASRTPGAIAAERAVVQALLKAHPHATVDVVIMRNVIEPAVSCADAAAVNALLDAVVYDGATAWGALDLRRAAGHAATNFWIVVSDGYATVGDIARLPATDTVPVHVLTGEADRAGGMLRLLSARSGGAYIDAALGADAAVARLTSAQSMLRIDAEPGALSDVQIMDNAGRSTALFKLTNPSAVITARWVQGNTTISRQTMTVTQASALPGRVVARAWAGSRAADLAVFPERNTKELVALGRRYGLVTPGTSLLVLERLDQYLRHRIAPPETWKSMFDQYQAAFKSRLDGDQRWGDHHLATLISQWEARVMWWEGKEARPAKPVLLIDRAAALSATSADEVGVHVPPTSVNEGGGSFAPPSPRAAEESVRDQAVAGAESESRDFPQIGATGGVRGNFGHRSGGGRVRSVARAGGDAQATEFPAAISIQPFQPDLPELRAIRDAVTPAAAYAAYLAARSTRQNNPSFVLDAANAMMARDQKLAKRVLSNLAELRIDHPDVLRVYAWRLSQAGDRDEAIQVLRRVLRLRPEEPQSQRDLALALAERARAIPPAAEAARTADVSEAATLLYRVAMRIVPDGVFLGEREALVQGWNRFPGLEVTALEELNALMSWSERQAWRAAPALPALDARLRRTLDTDVRVVMAWDADATDIDLHVQEPSGEIAFFGRNRTSSGGLVSPDHRQGYGPEEYLLRQAPSGTYDIRCRFYGSNRLTVLGPATVTATVFLDWGRPSERHQQMVLRLERSGEAIAIGSVRVGGGATPSDPAATAMIVITREQVRALRIGASEADVIAALGTPMRRDGGGVSVLMYRMSNGHDARLGFGPDLLWAKEVIMGAERDLLAAR